VPLLALDLDAAQKSEVAAELERWLAHSKIGLPTVPPFAPSFEAKRYWRGPVWAIMNWLLIEGLERNGMTGLAERLRTGTIAAIAATDAAEYFDPITGEGCGGAAFSWTAAAYLHFTQRAPQTS
jgi:glycogen debranching enzyme